MTGKKRLFSIAIFLMVFGLLPRVWAQVSVEASVDRSEVTLEDEIYLTVTVQGTSRASEPLLPPMPAFKAVASGTSTSIQIINGNMQSKKEFTYILVPKNEGTFTIDPITVLTDGREYKSAPITVKITSQASLPSPGAPVTDAPVPNEPSPTDEPVSGEPADHLKTFEAQKERESRDFWITAEVSNGNPYVNEQILYTFRFFTRVNIGTATLSVPEFQDFWSEEVVPEKKYYKTIGGDKFVVSEKVIALYPLKSGRLEIPETSLRIEVPEARQDRLFNDPFFTFPSLRMKPKNLRAEPIVLNVKPLPEGAPENFTNLVGQFGLSVNLSQPEIKMGDSTTLDVELSGRGNVKDGILPFKSDLPAFKIYDDKPVVETIRSEMGIQGKKSFKKAFVPIQSGEYSLPPFSVSYFDPQKGTYETLESPPLIVRVLPSEAERLNPVTGQAQAPEGAKIPLLTEDIATIHTQIDSLQTNEWGGGFKILVAAGLIFPPLLFFGTLGFQWRENRLQQNAVLYKSRHAYRGFLASVAKLRRKSAKDDEISIGLLDCIRNYVGDRLGLYGRSLTGDDITRYLESKKLNRDLIAVLDRLMHDLEYSRYGGGAIQKSADQWIAEAKDLVRSIDKKIHA